MVFLSLISLNIIAKKTCNFFLIKEANNDVIIEKVTLTENELKVFKDESILSYVMVFSPGSKSGEIIEKEQRIGGIIASYIDNTINVNILKKDGSQKDMPGIDLELASKTDVRLNITGANGYKKAFLVTQFNQVKEDDGPVLDLFSGQINLNEGDYSLFTECIASKQTKILEGSIPYEIYHGWITVNCDLGSGMKGRFVVDFGATTTVVPKNNLPFNTEIAPLEMVKYSAEKGEIKSKAVIAGATGSVNNIEGVCILDKLHFGDIEIKDLKVTVLNSFPETFNNLGIKGIIGRDVLMQTEVVHVKNLKNQSAEKWLILSRKNPQQFTHNYSVPFSFAGGGQIFMAGSISNIPVHFLFDSGAGSSYISNNFIHQNNIQFKKTRDKKSISYGIDGKGAEYEEVLLKQIEIGDVKIESMLFNMESVYAVEKSGSNEGTVLLGMNFLKNYNNVSFDFIDKKILLWKK